MDEAAFRELVSGQMHGVVPTLSRAGLTCLEPFYAGAVWLRNRCYDLGAIRAQRVPLIVVSVGNLTTGGTGKTPFVAWVANWFQQQGRSVGILSRGYRSLAGEANDEKLVLDQQCPGIPHVQCRDRVAGAVQLSREFGCKVVVLDDGFQHRRLVRDLNIVLIDALNPWGYGHELPRGLLRESVHEISRADVVIVTRADQCSADGLASTFNEVNRLGYQGERIAVAFQPLQLRNCRGETEELGSIHGKRVVAFCGIGNPGAFRATLESEGCEIHAFRAFPDHHHYGRSDLAEIAALAGEGNITAIVTTQKDLVKIPEANLGESPLWAVEIGVVFREGAGFIEERLRRMMG